MSGSLHWRVSTHCCRWWSESVRRNGSASSTLIRKLSKVIPAPDYGSTSKSPTNAVPVSILIRIDADASAHTSARMHARTCANRCEIELHLWERESEREGERKKIVFLRDIRFLFMRISSVGSIRRAHKNRRYRWNSSRDTHDGWLAGKFLGATWSGKFRPIPVAAGIFTASKNVILRSFRDRVKIQMKSKLDYE